MDVTTYNLGKNTYQHINMIESRLSSPLHFEYGSIEMPITSAHRQTMQGILRIEIASHAAIPFIPSKLQAKKQS